MASLSEVSKSSLINLKAELYRKQEESRQKRQAHSSSIPSGYQVLPGKHVAKASSSKPRLSKGKTKPSSNPGVAERIAKDAQILPPGTEKSWEQVREVLERKAKLYDKLSSQQYDPDEGESPLLVDFSQKQVAAQGKGRSAPMYDDTDSSDDEIGPVPLPGKPSDADDEWAEYEDHLGRTRRCLRTDLPRMLEENVRLKAETDSARASNTNYSRADDADVSPAAGGFDFGPVPLDERTLLSNDMQREMERQSWEIDSASGNSDARRATAGHPGKVTYNPHRKGPVFYETIRDNEIRDLGIGYFKFSTDPTTREEEFNKLQKLRQQTNEQRAHNAQLKAKRKALADARLAKIREKKNIKAVPEESRDEDLEEFEKTLEAAPVLHTKSKAELNATRTEPAPVREWDVGKAILDNEDLDKKYVEKRRTDRNPDFAPPEQYHKKDPPKQPKKNFPRPYSQNSQLSNVHEGRSSSASLANALPSAPSGDSSVNTDYKPWEHIPQWNNARATEKGDNSDRATKNLPVGSWSSVPPPTSYEDKGRPMAFHHVNAAEIREQAKALFKNKTGQDLQY
ncbi:coiled-coil domain-containing protein 174-like [Paramacrobiotus metropolitanus]|uniref:coiled-coil domain-containing protein 174-like n=1 Tax=Paramacrobiotus metropolitanus TaxID=2943436 RepID=UPI002445FACF|nr:coiled-coil domain-containing protein 174-like [Paramacrobiotus metropolitanus]XP_055338685.1 coiled-coil domain-containing protein 174-like [Paramacrobiotus metropolitanus]